MSQTRPAVERTQPPAAPFRVINAVMTAVLKSPLHRLVSSQLMLLHYRGRRSGRRFTLPVGRHQIRGRLAALTSSGWRANFRGGNDVELTFEGRRRAARAELLEEPAEVAAIYREIIEQIGHEKAGRRLGIRINVDRVPTLDELADAVRRSGLSVVFFDLPDLPA